MQLCDTTLICSVLQTAIQSIVVTLIVNLMTDLDCLGLIYHKVPSYFIIVLLIFSYFSLYVGYGNLK